MGQIYPHEGETIRLKKKKKKSSCRKKDRNIKPLSQTSEVFMALFMRKNVDLMVMTQVVWVLDISQISLTFLSLSKGNT